VFGHRSVFIGCLESFRFFVTNSYNITPIPFGQQKYVLLKHIKSGGMAAVWLGKSTTGSKRLVAIKRILPHVAEDTDFISMFIDEAKITVQLDHSNICKIYELGQDTDHYIVMEYVHGRDLRAVFDGCARNAMPPPIPLACYVMACCCKGLDYAHRRKDEKGKELGIVHRDVSLQNILVGFNGDVKIIDFGIAKAVIKSTKTAAGTLKGKFSYMSPEQVCAGPLDRRSDVFGIGICLYELLTGRRLFTGRTDFSVLEKVRKAEVALPTALNGNIPSVLEGIVMKALARNVEDRYAYASDLGDDLWHFLYGLDEIFNRKNLAEYMQASFAQQYAEEKQYLEECMAEFGPAAPNEQNTLGGQAGPLEDFVHRTETISDSIPPLLGPNPTIREPLLINDTLSMGQAESVAIDTGPAATSAEPIAPIFDPTLSETPNERSLSVSPPPLPLPPPLPPQRHSQPSGYPPYTPRSPQPSVLRKYLWVWVVSALAVLVALAILVWPTSVPKGNVLVEVPKGLQRVRVVINGEELQDKEGALQAWPRLVQVPAGKLHISMLADGYEPFSIEMEVPASESRYVRLSKTLQKLQTQ